MSSGVAAIVIVARTITLFLFILRRGGEPAGRATERLDMLKRNDAIQRQMLEAAARRFVILSLSRAVVRGCRLKLTGSRMQGKYDIE